MRAKVGIEEVVRELCRELARPGAVLSDHALLADLGLDSLACADLATGIEERLGVRLADGEVATLRTLADVAEAVRREVPPRPRISPGLGRYQAAAKLISGHLIRWYCRLEVKGADLVPAAGPAIIAANHRSMWDLPVHAVSTPRPITFIGKQELFADPIRRNAWRLLGGFPVRPEIADLRALDTAVALLEQGEAIGIYPEGTRSLKGQMLPFLKGAAWMALRTGAPIVPCGIRGTLRLIEPNPSFRKKVRVAFGPPLRIEPEPLPLARRRKADEITADLLQAITSLLTQP